MAVSDVDLALELFDVFEIFVLPLKEVTLQAQVLGLQVLHFVLNL